MLLTRLVVLTSSLSSLACGIAAQSLYTKPCPLLDLNYPAPSSYASNAIIQVAMEGLQNNITQALNQSTIYGEFDSQSNAFSVDVYSLGDEEPLFTYCYTGEGLTMEHTVGVETVDANSVFRIASISKMLTVYVYLIAIGDETWNQAVTRYVPELEAYMAENKASFQDNKINFVDWDSITIGALATHMSGISREEVYSPDFEQVLQSFGLPPTSRNDSGMCGNDALKIPCDRQAFFQDYLRQHPVTSPFTTPVYSNVAFEILGYALENMTGMPMAELFNDALVQRLGLNSTYYSNPPSPDTSFIPINTTISLWDFDARGESPGGGYFTSTYDLRVIGKSILNSTLLTPAQTRRWMKPHAFTSDTEFAIGAPWEILRAPGEPVSWIYTKSGDFGAYSSEVAYMPEYNIGITVLAAGSSPGYAVQVLSSLVVESVAPAVYTASQSAAVSAYTGTYSNSSANTTMTISLPDSGPGLLISEWTLNGTEVIPVLANLFGVNQTSQSLYVNLYPTGLSGNNGKLVSWRALFQVLPQPLNPGPFSYNCVSWGQANSVMYGGIGLDEFVFGLNQSGNATSVESRVLVIEYLRANGMEIPRSMRRMDSNI